ncbi:MAG: TolC family protein [Bacillota bacterium]
MPATKLRKFIVLLAGVLLVMLLAGTAFSADTIQTKSSADARQLSLSLNDAIKMAHENNSRIKLAKINYDNAVIDVDVAHDISKKLGRVEDYGLSMDSALAREFNERDKKDARTMAENNYRAALEAIDLSIRKMYFDLLAAQETQKAKQAALARAQEQQKNAQAAYKAGTVAKTDVLQADAAVASARADLVVASNNLVTLRMKLCKELGLPVGTQIVLTDKLDNVNNVDETLEKALQEAEKNRLDLQNAAISLDNAKARLKAVSDVYGSRHYMAQKAALGVQKADIDYNDTKQTVQTDITTALLNLQAAEQGYRALNQAVTAAQESLRLAKLRYQVGAANSFEVTAAAEKLADLEAKQISALETYQIARATLNTLKVTALTTSSSSTSSTGTGN